MAIFEYGINIQVHNILLNCTLFKTIRIEWELLTSLDNSF